MYEKIIWGGCNIIINVDCYDCIQVAISFLKVGQERCARSYYNELLNKAIQELNEAKKDNDFIYHERIPDVKHLELISKVVIAKPTPVPSRFSSKFKGIHLY